MSPERCAAAFELADGFRFVERLDVDRRIAYVDRRSVVVRLAGQPRPRRLYDEGHRQIACPLAWAHDGKTLFHAHEQIVALDTTTNEVREVTDFEGTDRFGVFWCLYVSPDDQLLFFQHRPSLLVSGFPATPARVCSIGTRGGGYRVLFEPDEGVLWTFDCDWNRGRIRAAVIVPVRGVEVWELGLDGKDRRRIEGARGQRARSPSGEHELSGSNVVVVHSVAEPDRDLFVLEGRCPSWSPDGASFAYVRDEHEVWLARVDGSPPIRLLTARRGNASEWRSGSYATHPIWSPDGRLLWFSSTTGRRHRVLRKPELLENIRAQHGEQSSIFKQAVENARWSFRHHAGIIDLAVRAVWVQRGYWTGVAFAPVA